MNKPTERIKMKDIAKLANVSVGTIDRVIHGRNGVSPKSRKRVEEILKQLDYHPNMYASALASNKKYHFECLLPEHIKGEYWTDIEQGISKAVISYSDFHTSAEIHYYNPYSYQSFAEVSERILANHPDGVILAPTVPEYTKKFTHKLQELDIPYIYIDSNISDTPPLAFFGQNSEQSGYFSARMLMLLAREEKEVVIFRKIHDGIIGSNQQKNREVGFRKYMNMYHPECKIWELNMHAEQDNKDNRMLKEFFHCHPMICNGITFNSKVYIIGEYLQKQQRRDFNLIGYDLLKRNVACLKQGFTSFLIAQQPELQGYNSVKALCEHLIFKRKVNRINYMPIDLLTVETIDYYHDK